MISLQCSEKENISPVIVEGEVEPVQAVAEEDSGQGGPQEEPHHGHSGAASCFIRVLTPQSLRVELVFCTS